MFVLIGKHTKSAEEANQYLEEHKAWSRRNFEAGRFLLAARQVPRVGWLILAVGQSEDEVRDAIAEDPFVTSGSAEYDVLEFDAVRSTPELESLIGKQPRFPFETPQPKQPRNGPTKAGVSASPTGAVSLMRDPPTRP